MKSATLLFLLVTSLGAKCQTTHVGVKLLTVVCPEPTAQQYLDLCQSGYDKEPPAERSGSSFRFQDDFKNLACVEPNDNSEIVAEKMQAMWNKHRAKVICTGFEGVLSSGANILKFSLETGFPTFIIDAVKKYKLDLNFIDPFDGK